MAAGTDGGGAGAGAGVAGVDPSSGVEARVGCAGTSGAGGAAVSGARVVVRFAETFETAFFGCVAPAASAAKIPPSATAAAIEPAVTRRSRERASSRAAAARRTSGRSGGVLIPQTVPRVYETPMSVRYGIPKNRVATAARRRLPRPAGSRRRPAPRVPLR